MKIKFNFSLKITITCLVLILAMLRASYWQWTRHLEKQEYIKKMQERLEEPILLINNLFNTKQVDDVVYKRVFVSGEYDYAKEITLANRRYNDQAGKYIITPLKIDNSNKYVLVNRGFVPLHLSKKEERKDFQNEKFASFVGLVKEGLEKKSFLAPKDPKPETGKFFDNWLRVNVNELEKQTKYPLLPFYVEIMNTVDKDEALKQIVKSSTGKSEMFLLPMQAKNLEAKGSSPTTNYPIPIFDTVIPAGRHFGYVFEWAFMALGLFIAGFILQLRRF